jgi:inorganic triphosphatase YgiF
VELSLVIVSDDPERVRRRLARLRRIRKYELSPRGSEIIVDRYFDTRRADLRKQGVALRLRTAGRSTVIGIKGRRRAASTHTEDRLELERPFSHEAVVDIGRRVGLQGTSVKPDVRSPDRMLTAALGVRLIQRRETRRLLRKVHDSSETAGPTLAELVVDRVEFQLEGEVVRHYEVEVEAKRTGRGTRATRELAAELAERYPAELVPWPYGKLATGRAIESLLRNNRFEKAPRDGALTARHYELIRRSLERRERATG